MSDMAVFHHFRSALSLGRNAIHDPHDCVWILTSNAPCAGAKVRFQRETNAAVGNTHNFAVVIY